MNNIFKKCKSNQYIINEFKKISQYNNGVHFDLEMDKLLIMLKKINEKDYLNQQYYLYNSSEVFNDDIIKCDNKIIRNIHSLYQKINDRKIIDILLIKINDTDINIFNVEDKVHYIDTNINVNYEINSAIKKFEYLLIVYADLVKMSFLGNPGLFFTLNQSGFVECYMQQIYGEKLETIYLNNNLLSHEIRLNINSSIILNVFGLYKS